MVEPKQDLGHRIRMLADWILDADRLVVFTGAGISTESGLADFRGPDGVWTRQEKGLPPRPMERDWSEVEPNAAHLAIVALQAMGKLRFLISQNVDNLHLKSGISPEKLAELHGNMMRLRCGRCERTRTKEQAADRCDCGGRFKSSVVNFGDSLPQRDLMNSYEQAQQCDLFMAVGSSLVVTPAADMPRVAYEAGAKLVIINQGETPLDSIAHLRFFESAGRVLPEAIRMVRDRMA